MANRNNQRTILILAAVAVALYAFSRPKKRRPVIEVHDLDKGEFVPDTKKQVLQLERGPDIIAPPNPPDMTAEKIDFLKPYRQTLAGCLTC